MNNIYEGYIYDSCSWGFIIAWNDGSHEEIYYNDFRDREDINDWLYNNNIADNFEEYKKGEKK